MIEEAEKELDDTRIFGMTHAEFEALPESERNRLLIPSLERIEEALGKLIKIVEQRGHL
jgi:hypothetical protein